MAEQLEDNVYDDDAAVAFIQEHLPQDAQGKFTDGQILYISDTVYEYFEENGMLNDEEPVDIDVEDLTEYVVRALKKDKDFGEFDPELVRWVVEGELDYEESLG